MTIWWYLHGLYLAILSSNFILVIYFCTFSTASTVCVTRAGAGGGTPSDWQNDKA
jgi:hypothetical protein